MTDSLPRIGSRMSEMTGVRTILKDIQQTLQTGAHERWINLSAGSPVILPEVEAMWRRLAREVIDGPEFGEIACRYGATQGYEPLIDAIVAWFNTHYRWGLTRRNVLITPGSQSLYFLAANSLAGVDGHGNVRRLLLPLSPDYTGYGGVVLEPQTLVAARPIIELIGAHRFKYRPDLDALRIDSGTGAVLFSRPCNPTGNALTDDEVRGIVALAARHDVPVLIDAAYGPPFPNLAFTAIRPFYADNVVYCMSLSKAGLPGERIGIAIGDERYLRLMEAFQANINIHASRLGQALAAAAIRTGELVRVSERVIKPYYQAKFEHVARALDASMPAVPWRLHQGEGAIFAWLWLPDLPVTDKELYERVKREKVFVVPGSHFFPGLAGDWRHTQECLRISLTATDEEIECGIAALGRVVDAIYSRG